MSNRQEIVCLIGASGCGKSTLLRLLTGLDEPSIGDVVVGGESSAGDSVKSQQARLIPLRGSR